MGRRGADSARAFHVYFSTEGDSVDYPQYSVYDAGEMPNEVMITATCEFGDGDGTLCMFDGPIQCEGFGPGEYTICGTYKDGLAQLWVDDELAGEQECNWCMAEGGLLSLCSGSHQEGDEKDEAPEGSIAISNVYIATQ